jgi:hypothetical protein
MPNYMPPDEVEKKTREYEFRIQEAKVYLNSLAADLEDDSFVKLANFVYHSLEALEGIDKEHFVRS